LNSKKRCALLILTPIEGKNWNESICSKRNMFYSNKFIKDIGELDLPNEFGFTWEFIKDYKYGKRFNDKGEISLSTIEGEN
jgi:hypothetical protein